MAALDLGDVAEFPFVDPPDQRAVADGLALLEELHALDEHGKLTETGRALAALPLDPRMARMVVEADRRGVLDEVLVIAAGLTIQDPRERPTEHQQAADQLHARFADENSDFLALLNLWRYLGEQQEALSRQPVPAHREARVPALPAHPRVAGPARPAPRHRPPAGHDGRRRRPARPTRRASTRRSPPGCCRTSACRWSRPSTRDGKPGGPSREYLGTRNTRFVIAPGTPLAKKPPRWVVAAELVETSRLFARTVARIDPEEVERLADAPGQAAVLRAALGRQARLRRGHRAGHAVRAAARRGPPRAVRLDRPGRLPRAVHPARPRRWASGRRTTASGPTTSGRSSRSRRWRSGPGGATSASTTRPCSSSTTPASPPTSSPPGTSTAGGRPPAATGRTCSPSRRRCSPTRPRPGRCASRTIRTRSALTQGAHPAAVLRLRARRRPRTASPSTSRSPSSTGWPRATSGESLAFTVPGLREELVTALLRALPKQLRRALVPIPDRVREVLPHIDPGEPLLPALERELRRAVAVADPAGRVAAGPGARPPAGHLPGARRPASARWPRARTSRRCAGRSRRRAGPASPGPPRTWSAPGLTSWELGDLPRTVEVRRAGHVVTAYPALVDEGETVGVRVVPTEAEADRLTWGGARRLLVLVAGSPVRQVVKGLSPSARLALQFNPDGEIPDLVADCVDAAADELIAAAGGPPRDRAAFDALVATAKQQLLPLTTRRRPARGGRADPGPRGGDRDRRGARPAGAGRGRRRPPPADGRAAAPGLRGLGRAAPAARRRALPAGHGPPAGEAAGERGAGRAVDAAGRRGDGGVRAAAASGARHRAVPTTRSRGSAG